MIYQNLKIQQNLIKMNKNIKIFGQGHQVAGHDIIKSKNKNVFTVNGKNITIKQSTAIISLIVSFIIGVLSSLLASYIFEFFCI